MDDTLQFSTSASSHNVHWAHNLYSSTGTNLEHNCTRKEFRCEFRDCVQLCVSHPAIQHAADADDHAAACMHACTSCRLLLTSLGPSRTPSWRWPWTPCCWADGFSTPHATSGRLSGALRSSISSVWTSGRPLPFSANGPFLKRFSESQKYSFYSLHSFRHGRTNLCMRAHTAVIEI